MTDVDIPRRVWSAWRESGKQRQIRRALTSEERSLLVARRDELQPWVVGYHADELDEVALALTDMFGSFTSMRQSGEEAAGRVDAARRILVSFPVWAIERACVEIRTNGVFREERFDRQWPPNDSEIIAAVREKMRIYGDTYEIASALLCAEVES